MAQYDSTTFVNVDDKEFKGYFGGEEYVIKAGQSVKLVQFVAKHLAKHLIDRILQEKYGIKNTLSDTPVRRNLMAKILPDEAAKAEYKSMTPEEEKKALEDVLNKQAETIKSLQGRQGELEKKLEGDNELKKELEELKKTLAEVVKEPKETIKKTPRKVQKPASPAPESPEIK